MVPWIINRQTSASSNTPGLSHPAYHFQLFQKQVPARTRPCCCSCSRQQLLPTYWPQGHRVWVSRRCFCRKLSDLPPASGFVSQPPLWQQHRRV